MKDQDVIIYLLSQDYSVEESASLADFLSIFDFLFLLFLAFSLLLFSRVFSETDLTSLSAKRNQKHSSLIIKTAYYL